MSADSIATLLVTANVGSIFEDPIQMLKVWTDEFLSTVLRINPKFIALHCQEVGGKNYENSMKHVQDFVNLLLSSNELSSYDKVRIFLDEDYTSAENFTALGNFYFIHQDLDDVQIFNFKDRNFEPVSDKETHSGNIEAVLTKEKAKFPQDFFPECKWSRKGFLRTRWYLRGTMFDLINIHLFHDASNFIAMEESPSVYCKNRRRALEHTLERFHNDEYENVPYFLFGDFNFRTDTDGVIKKLTQGLNVIRIQSTKNNNEFVKLQFTNKESETVLTVGKKEFNHSNHQDLFLSPTECWLKEYDKELDAFANTLTEFPITFPPSYPFEENILRATSFMQTRCPAWCDRILLSITAKKLIDENDKVDYNLMGLSTCMGDHKPVYLKASIKGDSGIIRCCNHAQYDCLPVTCKCCHSFASIKINVTDMSDYLISTRKSFNDLAVDSRLLHEPIITKDMLSHDPYTPESVDSHSPNPEKIDIDEEDQEAIVIRRNSVTPEQLLSHLEKMILSDGYVRQITRSQSHNVNVNGNPKDAFRTRAMSELPRKSSSSRRTRLISAASTSVQSTLRLQSHHSSSDEDWFEFEEIKTDNNNGNSDKVANNIVKVTDLNTETKINSNMNDSKERRKMFCCSVT